MPWDIATWTSKSKWYMQMPLSLSHIAMRSDLRQMEKEVLKWGEWVGEKRKEKMMYGLISKLTLWTTCPLTQSNLILWMDICEPLSVRVHKNAHFLGNKEDDICGMDLLAVSHVSWSFNQLISLHGHEEWTSGLWSTIHPGLYQTSHDGHCQPSPFCMGSCKRSQEMGFYGWIPQSQWPSESMLSQGLIYHVYLTSHFAGEAESWACEENWWLQKRKIFLCRISKLTQECEWINFPAAGLYLNGYYSIKKSWPSIGSCSIKSSWCCILLIRHQ